MSTEDGKLYKGSLWNKVPREEMFPNIQIAGKSDLETFTTMFIHKTKI